MLTREAVKPILKERNVKAFCIKFFNFNPTKKQEEIIRTIAYQEHNRVVISCMTRYGKTRCVAIGVCLYILLSNNKKIILVSPILKQTSILRNYIAEHITECSLFDDLIEIEYKDIDRIKKEFSKSRLTFKNGCELQILSAEGTAERLMGFGGNLIIVDESCLIEPEVYRTKISRMLGDSPDSILIEIGNPWRRGTHFEEHWNNSSFHRIHVDYKTALEEGRITELFLKEQEELLTPIEFTILYKSEFPEESEDSLISHKHIEAAVNRFQNIKDADLVIGADIADKGMDKTVIIKAKERDNHYLVLNIYSEAKSENTAVAGRIIAMQEPEYIQAINIDSIGVGIGIISMIREKLTNKSCKLTACNFGMAANDKRFLNKKAEMYFRLKSLFEQGMISIPDHEQLKKELTSMRWEHTSAGKIKIIDPERSPDFADALVYTIWKTSSNNYSIH